MKNDIEDHSKYVLVSTESSLEMYPKSLYQHQVIVKDDRKKYNINTGKEEIPSKFCFAHVGKTAGGTISCRLSKSLAKNCPDDIGYQTGFNKSTNKDKNSSALSNVAMKSSLSRNVVGKIHKQREFKSGCSNAMSSFSNTNNEKEATFLFSIRNPIDRIRSWYHYEYYVGDGNEEDKKHSNDDDDENKKENTTSTPVHGIVGNRPHLYEDCFDRFDDLISIGLKVAIEGVVHNSNISNHNEKKEWATENGIKYHTCAQRAWKAVTGIVGFQYHNVFNYEYYLNWVNDIMMHRQSVVNQQHPTKVKPKKYYVPSPPIPDSSTTSIVTTRTINNNFSSLPSKATILVIRSEHLTEDWNRLEEIYNRRSYNIPHLSYLSSQQQQTRQEEREGHVRTVSDNSLEHRPALSSNSFSKEVETATRSANVRHREDMYFDQVRQHSTTTTTVTKKVAMTTSNEAETTISSSSPSDQGFVDDEEQKSHHHGYHYLCLALCREIWMYWYMLLLPAKNLSFEQKQQSRTEIIQTCPNLVPLIFFKTNDFDEEEEKEKTENDNNAGGGGTTILSQKGQQEHQQPDLANDHRSTILSNEYWRNCPSLHPLIQQHRDEIFA